MEWTPGRGTTRRHDRNGLVAPWHPRPKVFAQAPPATRRVRARCTRRARDGGWKASRSRGPHGRHFWHGCSAAGKLAAPAIRSIATGTLAAARLDPRRFRATLLAPQWDEAIRTLGAAVDEPRGRSRSPQVSRSLTGGPTSRWGRRSDWR